MSKHSLPRQPVPRRRRPRGSVIGLAAGALVPIAVLVAGSTVLTGVGTSSAGAVTRAAGTAAPASDPADPPTSAAAGNPADPAPSAAAGNPADPLRPAGARTRGPAGSSTNQAAPNQAAPNQAAPNQAAPNQAAPNQAAPTRAGDRRTPTPMAVRGRPAGNGAAAPAVNPNCTLVVPPDPLSAQGLATPYQLIATDRRAGPCHEARKEQSAFVQGAVLTPQGQLTLYNPLVVDAGTRPAAPPAPALVPAGSTVALWFGFNGDVLTLRSAAGADGLAQGSCVNGSRRSVFGQFAYCNAPAFFRAADAAIAAGQLSVPAPGTASDGMPCPTVRDFSMVDQDQSDNVNTHYLATADGRTAQPGAALAGAAGTNDLANGSDNRLLTEFIQPTLGCKPFTRPDQSDNGREASSLPLQELQAAAGQAAPVALVPTNDPMVLEGGRPSVAKTNLYRAGVDQPAIGAGDDGNPTAYCRNIFADPHGVQRVFADRQILAAGPTANPQVADNLFTFLAARAHETFTNLGCGNLLGQANPIRLTSDAAGVVRNATFAARRE